jgi:ATP-dependent Clp protease ATP-binding subunit ClpA
MSGGLGFSCDSSERDDELDQKIYRVATEAARRKFSPEFMNRIDKVIVFRTLQRSHLERILDIELNRVQQRILNSPNGGQFVFRCTQGARELLLEEGTDSKCGARHLKRAIERHLVFPLSNLMATEQVRLGDLVTVDYSASTSKMTFHKDEQGALEEGLMGARATAARVTSVGSPSALRAFAANRPKND